ncbi:MAG: hypothetical protein ACRDRX_01260 [Pseudonocardiaceae bacterium]
MDPGRHSGHRPRLAARRVDRQGSGGANLIYVNAQFQAVAQLLQTAGHGGQVTRRLLVVLAELGQLTGWMAADAGRDGLAQRYYGGDGPA